MKKSKDIYATLMCESIDNELARRFAFNNINFSWIYSVSPVTIIDTITQQYLETLDEPRYFDILRASIRFEYATPYIHNIIGNISEYYTHLYNDCMECPERTPCQYCDMEPIDVRKCIERKHDKFYSDMLWDSS